MGFAGTAPRLLVLDLFAFGAEFRLDAATGKPVDPAGEQFSGFIFKIQANMNKNHRDRIAFLRICSGKFECGMEAYHVQGGKAIKLATGTALMADDRATVDEAEKHNPGLKLSEFGNLTF